MKKEFNWQTRYSSTEKSDRYGRWARLCYLGGLLIAWINRVEHVDYGTFYTVTDFFPSSGNDIPGYFGNETSFEKAREGIEKRFNEFLNHVCNCHK